MFGKNKKTYIGFGISVLLVFTVMFSTVPVFDVMAQSLQDLNQELEISKRRIDNLFYQAKYYKEKVDKAKLEIYSLEDELNNISDSIESTDEVIEDTIYRVDAKKKSINKISKDIVKQSIDLEQQKGILTEIVQEMYTASEFGEADLLDLILYSGNFKDALNDVEYLDILHDQGEKSMYSIKGIRRDMEVRKLLLEDEEASLSQLLDALDRSKAILKDYEDAKKLIIERTRGEEKEYQIMVQEVKDAQLVMQQVMDNLVKDIEIEKERLAKLKRVSLGNGDLIWPLQGRITTYFQDPTYPFINILGQHQALDIAAPRGTILQAAHGGIATIGNSPRGYGKYVIITAPSKDGGIITSLYAHMNKIYISNGSEINVGDAIGEVGSTGFSTGPHVHFEVRVNKAPVNPLIYLP